MSASRRSRTPRKAATFRAARRNAVLRGKVKGAWPGVETKRQNWIAKPPIIRFDWSLMALGKSPILKVRHRKQPKTYPYSSKRQNTRGTRRRAA